MNSKTIFLLLLLNTSACTSLMYHPSRIKYVKPETLSLPPQEIIFSETNNQKLVAWFFKGILPSKGIILIFHGNAQNVSSHFFTQYWALNKGYDVFIFDYPGFGGSQGEPNPQNTVDAGLKAIEYIKNKWPNLPIVIDGQSLGGAVALRALSETQNKINCAVIESSFLSYKNTGKNILSKQWFTWPFQWLPYLVLSDEFAPIKTVNSLPKIPYLVIHRDQDPVVDFKLGEKLFEKLPEPKQFLRLKGEGHVDHFTSSDAQENQKIFLEFLEKCKKN